MKSPMFPSFIRPKEQKKGRVLFDCMMMRQSKNVNGGTPQEKRVVDPSELRWVISLQRTLISTNLQWLCYIVLVIT